MKFDVKIPEVGESISEVVLAKWLKKDGEVVEVDDLLCEIESDKASFEIPAEQAGAVKHMAKEGDTVAVGGVIAQIDGDAAPESSKAEEKKSVSAIPAKDEKTETSAPAEKAKPSPAKSPDSEKDKKIKVSPVAANILVKAGLTADSVSGSGPGGRVTKEDAVKAVEDLKTREKEAPSPDKAAAPEKKEKPAPAVSQPSESPDRQVRRERLSTLRKTLSKRLVAAKNETAMLTTFNEVDMSGIMALRAKYKEIFKEKYEVGLGFMSFFTKAACIALKEWPAVNAKIDGDEVVYHEYCDISIAVSSPRGLVVPVIRNADRLSLAEIEKEVLDLATKARDNKLTIEEMTGGTFTISNGGVFGSLMSTPILNAPQSAILGMHKIEERPVVINGEIVIRPMMYLAVSYDHRIIDGRESVSFLVRIKELLEDPARMLLEI